MEYLMGLLNGVVIFIAFFVGIYVGTRFDNKQKPPDIDNKEKQKIKEFNDEFQKLFNYDVPQAIARKKV